MIQHLSQEVNYLVRSNPLLMQGEEEVSSLAHRRQCGHSSPFSRDPPLGRLSAWRPRLAEERCQRNIRLVLKIENCPVFPHCLAYFGERIFQPFLACLGIRLEVLTFRFLIRQSCVTKPSPDRVLRHDDLQLLLYDLVYPCHRPQICFKCRAALKIDTLAALENRHFEESKIRNVGFLTTISSPGALRCRTNSRCLRSNLS